MAEVTVLGMGRMGAAMARRIAAAGHSVRVWNRTFDGAARVAAGDDAGRMVAAASAREAVEGADVVVTMLANGDVTCEVLLAPTLLEAVGHEAVVVDMGTSGVDAAARLSAAFAHAGLRYVDAPVSGSVPAVDSGTLVVMASGEPHDVDQVREVLGTFAALVLHVGAAGRGQVMKLAVNLVVHDLNAAVSESLALAEAAGVSVQDAYDVLQHSVVGAPFVHYKRAAYLDATVPVAMSLDLVAKDLGLILDLGARSGVPLGTTLAAYEQVRAAVEAGRGTDDMAGLARFLRDETSP